MPVSISVLFTNWTEVGTAFANFAICTPLSAICAEVGKWTADFFSIEVDIPFVGFTEFYTTSIKTEVGISVADYEQCEVDKRCADFLSISDSNIFLKSAFPLPTSLFRSAQRRVLYWSRHSVKSAFGLSSSHCIALKRRVLAKVGNAPEVGNGFVDFLIHFHSKSIQFQKNFKIKFIQL